MSCDNCKFMKNNTKDFPCRECKYIGDDKFSKFEPKEGYSFADGIRETKGMNRSE